MVIRWPITHMVLKRALITLHFISYIRKITYNDILLGIPAKKFLAKKHLITGTIWSKSCVCFNQCFMWSVSDPCVQGRLLSTMNLKVCVLMSVIAWNFGTCTKQSAVHWENRAVAFAMWKQLLRKMPSFPIQKLGNPGNIWIVAEFLCGL